MRSKKSTSNTVFFDRSGELVDVIVPHAPRPQRGPLYSYLGGFVVISIDGMKRLVRMRLHGCALRLLFCLFEHLDGNVIHSVSNAALAERLGIHGSVVSRALTQLESVGVIQRTGQRGVILLNPHYGFLGTAIRQRAAVKQWDAMHRPIAVPSQIAG